MKIALVLCGGGSLGSYEVGAIKKLIEKGIKFDIVTGTSIGALNGYFVATEQFDKAIELWETIKNDDVFRWGVENRGKAISDAFLNRDRKNPVNQTVAMLGSLAGLDLYDLPRHERAKGDLKPSERKPRLGLSFRHQRLLPRFPAP